MGDCSDGAVECDDQVAGVGKDALGLLAGEVFPVTGEVEQEAGDDAGESGCAVEAACAEVPSLGFGEPDGVGGEGEDLDVPFVVQEPVKGAGGLVDGAVAGA